AGQNSTARPHPPCIDQAANHSGTLSSSLSSLSILNGNAFPAKIDKIEILPKALELGRLRVVLVSTRNPLNIGAAARAMSNFGFPQLRLVNPYEAAFRQATSAVGAADLMANAEEYKSVAEAVADCSLVVGTTAVGKRTLHQPLQRLEQGASVIRKRL